MPPAQQAEAASLFLSLALAVFALLLGSWLVLDRRHRGDALSEEDLAHFARQDLRRGVVLIIILLLSAGIFFGTRLEPRVAGRANPLFVQVWLGVSVLILLLITLAVFDGMATRLYARRQYREMARERLEILRDELRRQSPRIAEQNGSGGPIGDSRA